MIDYSYVKSGFVYGEAPYEFNIADIFPEVCHHDRWARDAEFFSALVMTSESRSGDALPIFSQVEGRGVNAGFVYVPAHTFVDSELMLKFAGNGDFKGRDYPVPSAYRPKVGFDFYGKCPFDGSATADYTYNLSPSITERRFIAPILVLYLTCLGRVWFMAVGTNKLISGDTGGASPSVPDFLSPGGSFSHRLRGHSEQVAVDDYTILNGRASPILELCVDAGEFIVFPWKVFIIDKDLYDEPGFIKPSMEPVGEVDDLVYGKSMVFVEMVPEVKELNKELYDTYLKYFPGSFDFYEPKIMWSPALPFIDSV